MAIAIYNSISLVQKPRVFDVHAMSKSKATPSTDMGVVAGFENWLPFAAKELHISSSVNDYLMYPVPIMYSDLPNRNGVAFPLGELAKWNVKRGCQAYYGWKGMPMFEEHRSEDHTKALGVIADAAMRRMDGMGHGKLYKVVCLAAIDRTKNPDLAREVEAGDLNSYSMGAMVDGYHCSHCGAEIDACTHVSLSKPIDFYEMSTMTGRELIYRNVYGIDPYELSVVRDPAYGTATSDHLITYG
jgi:hypothetical protein